MQLCKVVSITDSRYSSRTTVKSRSSGQLAQISKLFWSSPTHSIVSAPSQVLGQSWHSSRRSLVCRKTGDNVLPYAIMAIILDAKHKFDIITEVINEEINLVWEWLDFYKPPEVRFTEKTESESEKYNERKKCKKYSCILRKTLETCLDELMNSGTFEIIEKVEKRFIRQLRDEERLRQEHYLNKKHLRKVRRALENVDRVNKAKLNKKADELQKIRGAYEDKLAYSHFELDYVSAYEDNRCYLKKFFDDKAEQNLREEISKYQEQIANEHRIHSEIEEYLESYATHVENETKDWISKYDADEERLDQEISEAKERKEKLERQNEDLQREFRQRSIDIDKWLAKRKLIKEEEETLKIRNHAATIIQAWWRGEMQRKHLGPFSNKRKGKKGAKAKARAKAKNIKLKK